MPHNRDDMFFHPPDSVHYDAELIQGGSLNGVEASEICGLRPSGIKWLWVVEQNRYATPEEIRNLCKVTCSSV